MHAGIRARSHACWQGIPRTPHNKQNPMATQSTFPPKSLHGNAESTLTRVLRRASWRCCLRCGCRLGACAGTCSSHGRRCSLGSLPVSCLHQLLCRGAAQSGGCVGASGGRLCGHERAGRAEWCGVRLRHGCEWGRRGRAGSRGAEVPGAGGPSHTQEQAGELQAAAPDLRSASSPPRGTHTYRTQTAHNRHPNSLQTALKLVASKLTLARHAHKLAAHTRPLVGERLRHGKRRRCG